MPDIASISKAGARPSLSGNQWGLASFALVIIALGLEFNWENFIQRWMDIRLVPYILFLLAALACSILAAIRGRKAWLLFSAVIVFLAAQATIALLVGD